MKEWLGKPLLIVGIILAVLAAGSAWYIQSGPDSAQANPQEMSQRQMQYNKAISDIERDR